MIILSILTILVKTGLIIFGIYAVVKVLRYLEDKEIREIIRNEKLDKLIELLGDKNKE
ncbi:hypothetical protein [Bacillus sp. FJAT-49736]|uniref:hypothetical protein n=1 Tax=Bacillus sp. FJAT-49736 TaxID=2833582 RepID=UPI001BC9A971|nr:hypothetical protein [Bacillus sp. FJAT-49736]MBS4172714.1 hypothetical protein [Bacillus sp. FJAT-49736]